MPYTKRYYEENKAKIRGAQREPCRRYQEKNKERYKEYYRDYFQRNKERIYTQRKARYRSPETIAKQNEQQRNWRRQHLLYVNGIRIRVEKRLYPLNSCCEVCGKEFKRLDYHHWEDEQPEQGVWVCYKCHQQAEYADNLWLYLNKYLELKEAINQQ